MEEAQVKSHQAETTENRNRRLKEKMRADSNTVLLFNRDRNINKIMIVYDSCAANVHVQCYGDAERAQQRGEHGALAPHDARSKCYTAPNFHAARGGIQSGLRCASLRHALSQILHRFSDLIAAQYASRFAHQTHHGAQVDRSLNS